MAGTFSKEAPPKEPKPMSEILSNAGKRALGGGIAGSAAMVVQVSTLMWIRTIMNYQYRYGMGLRQATSTLYAEGGILRFYRGYFAAIAQGPLSRFGDTAANAGVLALLDANESTASLPAAVKTVGASGMAATWRIAITPIDTVKTIMQVEGKPGLDILFAKSRAKGPTVFWHGAVAASAATFVGHYPWFATYNTLQEVIPQYDELPKKLARNAGIGFVSSVISDTISNSLRVVKTYRQTNPDPISYSETVKKIVDKDGYVGLFGRGLQTRIIANGMQGLMFSVMWRYFDEEIKKRGLFGTGK
ncbi:unnamed protein product [Amoebophrya sp. A25]|nr:unnamed protein product [Amoebophrya sp. A25]|eukprot:GSA25T00004802001.1